MIATMASTQLERDVARILDSVERSTTTTRPALLVLVGLPATGKTFVARELQSRTGAVVLESDAIRSLLFRPHTYRPSESRRLFAALHAAIDALLAERRSVILDATNLAERERRPLYDAAERHQAKLVIACVTAPAAIARERLDRRPTAGSHSQADLAVYQRMQSRIEEIQRLQYTIDTSGEIEPALHALEKEMMDS